MHLFSQASDKSSEFYFHSDSNHYCETSLQTCKGYRRILVDFRLFSETLFFYYKVQLHGLIGFRNVVLFLGYIAHLFVIIYI